MRIRAIILVVLALVLVLSGCGNNSDASNKTDVSKEVVTDIEIDEAMIPEETEPEEIITLSTEVVLPENVNTNDLVDNENELTATVSNTTKEATEKYVQTLVDSGYNLDYMFESENAIQYSLSTNEINVYVMLKNDEMMINASRFE